MIDAVESLPVYSDRGSHSFARRRDRLRAIAGGSAGNLVEYFDWYVYASFTLYFAPAFFPKGDLTIQLLQAAVIFFVGFLARPLGGLVMGRYADRSGRRAALTLSVGTMCGGSLVIALTPSYQTIGWAAPAILLLARLLQGVSMGGEYGASAAYLAEVAGGRRRGFWCSFHITTVIMGQLLALGLLIIMQNILTTEQLSNWGWRAAFLLGAALAVVVFWMRRRLDETADFRTASNPDGQRGSLGALFREYPRETLTVVGLTAGGGLLFYIYTTYMQKFLVNTSGFSPQVATLISAMTLLIFALVQPLFGLISDYVGRRTMLIGTFVLGLFTTWPIMKALSTITSPMTAFWLILAALLMQSGYTSISAVFKAELFPAHVRATGVAFPFACTQAIFAGSAEYLALWFKSVSLESGFFIYTTIVVAIGLIVTLTMADPRAVSKFAEDN